MFSRVFQLSISGRSSSSIAPILCKLGAWISITDCFRDRHLCGRRLDLLPKKMQQIAMNLNSHLTGQSGVNCKFIASRGAPQHPRAAFYIENAHCTCGRVHIMPGPSLNRHLKFMGRIVERHTLLPIAHPPYNHDGGKYADHMHIASLVCTSRVV